MLTRLATEAFDLVVVGGGATGLGVALDAAMRGLRVALFESHDFAKGTSSRATKLIHGGVRYMAQGRMSLVRESLRERSILLRNAPGLVRPLRFIVPAYRPWELPLYGAGLAVYDALAGRHSLGPTRLMGAGKTRLRVPGVRSQGLKGGVEYWDAQFDDAGLALALARAAAEQAAVMLNYFRVTAFVHDHGRVAGVQALDTETDRQFEVRARCVINATGVWVDELRRLEAQGCGRKAQPLIRASRGTHLVVDRCFFPSEAALLVPRTADGRVLFAVPWMGKVILGTTDVAAYEPVTEPTPDKAEIDYILNEAGRYLQRPPHRKDVTSAWAGLRPLVEKGARAGTLRGHSRATAQIGREHAIEISPSGLLTIAGGKWTTYRAMAQSALEAGVRAGLLPDLPPCATHQFALGRFSTEGGGPTDPFLPHRSDAAGVAAVTDDFVRHVARYEFARTVEDVLARRSRLLFLDAAAAARVAPDVARILQHETQKNPELEAFLALALSYSLLH